MERQVKPYSIRIIKKPEDFILKYEKEEVQFTRSLLELYSTKIKSLNKDVHFLHVQHGSNLNKLHELVQNKTHVSINEETLRDVHGLALELGIPKFLEITIPFLSFLQFVEDAIRSLDGTGSEDLQKASANFLSHFYIFFSQTEFFKHIKPSQWKKLVLNENIYNTPKDFVLNSLHHFLRTWSDREIADCLKLSYFASDEITTATVSEFLSDLADIDDVSLDQTIQSINILQITAKVAPKKNVDENQLWDELHSFFTQSNFSEDDYKEIENIKAENSQNQKETIVEEPKVESKPKQKETDEQEETMELRTWLPPFSSSHISKEKGAHMHFSTEYLPDYQQEN